MKISIVIPCFNEYKYLPQLLDSLKNQTIHKNKQYSIHHYIIDGNSTDGSYAYLVESSKTFPELYIISNPDRFVSSGLNLAIKMALSKGADYIIRMDVHAKYDANYIEKLIKRSLDAREKGIRLGNYGGLVNTLPGENTKKAYAISRILSSKFGVGGSLFRTGSQGVTSVDTVPFGCFPKEIFDRVGYFDTELIRNQDDEFNGRIINAGFQILLDSEIITQYFSRSNFTSTARMFYQYGLFKPLVNLKLGKAATLRQYAPPFFVSTLFLLALLATISLIPLSLYITLYFAFALVFYLKDVRSPKSKGIILAFHSIIGITIVHTSYGLGYIHGIINRYLNIPFNKIETSR